MQSWAHAHTYTHLHTHANLIAALSWMMEWEKKLWKVNLLFSFFVANRGQGYLNPQHNPQSSLLAIIC